MTLFVTADPPWAHLVVTVVFVALVGGLALSSAYRLYAVAPGVLFLILVVPSTIAACYDFASQRLVRLCRRSAVFGIVPGQASCEGRRVVGPWTS